MAAQVNKFSELINTKGEIKMNKKLVVATMAVMAVTGSTFANGIVVGQVEPNTTAPVVSGYNSAALGANTVVTGTSVIVLGRDNKVSGNDTTVIGSNNGTVSANQTTIIGYNNKTNSNNLDLKLNKTVYESIFESPRNLCRKQGHTTRSTRGSEHHVRRSSSSCQ